ncbi:MAG: EamA family transporter [Elusimicrobia bacterium]|nr:EamA family transporter [Elusimicrobiota bacterium]
MWLACSLGAVVFWASWSYCLKIAVSKAGWASATAVSVWAEAAALLVFLPIVFKSMDKSGLAWSVAAGLCGVIGLGLFNKALSLGQLALVVPVTSFYTILAVVLGTVFLGEALNLRQITGCILALAAVFLVSK